MACFKVVGPFQDASQDLHLHSLLECITDAKLKARGREGSDWERGIILNGFRRELSLVAAKAVSACVSPRQGSSVHINIDDTADVGLGGVGHAGIVGYIGVG